MCFNKLQENVLREVLVAEERLLNAQQSIRQNLASGENPQGLLCREEKSYIDCIKIDQ